MKKLFRPLGLAAVLGIGGIAGTNALLADDKPRTLPTEPPVVTGRGSAARRPPRTLAAIRRPTRPFSPSRSPTPSPRPTLP